MFTPNHVTLTVVSGRNLVGKGKNGKNDAFVVVQVGEAKVQSAIRQHTLIPTWEEKWEFLVPSFQSTYLHVTVYHRTVLGLEDFLGQIRLALTDVYDPSRDGVPGAEPNNRWYPLKGKSGRKDEHKYRGEIELQFEFSSKPPGLSSSPIHIAGPLPSAGISAVQKTSTMGAERKETRKLLSAKGRLRGSVPSLANLLTRTPKQTPKLTSRSAKFGGGVGTSPSLDLLQLTLSNSSSTNPEDCVFEGNNYENPTCEENVSNDSFRSSPVLGSSSSRKEPEKDVVFSLNEFDIPSTFGSSAKPGRPPRPIFTAPKNLQSELTLPAVNHISEKSNNISEPIFQKHKVMSSKGLTPRHSEDRELTTASATRRRVQTDARLELDVQTAESVEDGVDSFPTTENHSSRRTASDMNDQPTRLITQANSARQYQKTTSSATSAGLAFARDAALARTWAETGLLNGGLNLHRRPWTQSMELIDQRPSSMSVVNLDLVYDTLSKTDLIGIIKDQRKEIGRQERKIRDMEEYIDNLLAKVMERDPFLLEGKARHPPLRLGS